MYTLLSFSSVAFAQSDAQAPFEKLKALAGEWEGTVTTVPAEPTVEGKIAHVSLRVTSMGNALMHEMRIPGRPDDPITMIYVDDNRLLLVHYCDAGNRPRMAATATPDGKTIQFNLIDVSGGTQFGHMHNAGFAAISPCHHTEDWTFMGKGPVQAHFDLQRKK
jgi:hypothetical protein